MLPSKESDQRSGRAGRPTACVSASVCGPRTHQQPTCTHTQPCNDVCVCENCIPNIEGHADRPTRISPVRLCALPTRMPLSKSVAYGVGVWKPSDGFFSLDERLAKVRIPAGLTASATHHIFAADNPVINNTVISQFGVNEAYIREVFLRVFRSRCDGGNFVFADSGSNEGTWSLVAAAHGCRRCGSGSTATVHITTRGRGVKRPQHRGLQ